MIDAVMDGAIVVVFGGAVLFLAYLVVCLLCDDDLETETKR